MFIAEVNYYVNILLFSIFSFLTPITSSLLVVGLISGPETLEKPVKSTAQQTTAL